MSYLKDTPLGRSSDFIDEYTPSLLCPVPRWDARESLELEDTTLPFHGMDIWNAYELSWLNDKGKPQVALAELIVPCTSPNIIESKSLKLYLNSFANSRFDSRDRVVAVIAKDLAEVAGAPVDVRVMTLREAERNRPGRSTASWWTPSTWPSITSSTARSCCSPTRARNRPACWCRTCCAAIAR